MRAGLVIAIMAPMALWGQDKPAQKRQGVTGEGWLRSPHGFKAVRIVSAGETLHAKWVTVADADVVNGSMQVRHNRRMLRYNAEKLWKNLILQGWRQVPPQW